jgi:hypothetical protein
MASCGVCSTDPSSYVLRKVADKGLYTVFYTHPSKVKTAFRPDDIIAHYQHRLHENGSKKWVWVFDGSQFDTDHIMELKTGQGIAELLAGPYGDLLVEIKIINPTIHLKVLLKVIRPFMTDILISKLNIMDDRPHSVLEFL